jgi:hypothetical protein
VAQQQKIISEQKNLIGALISSNKALVEQQDKVGAKLITMEKDVSELFVERNKQWVVERNTQHQEMACFCIFICQLHPRLMSIS